MGIRKSMLIILISAFFVLIGCDSNINFDKALNVYDEDANLLTNIASEVVFDSILITTTTSEIFTIENTGSSNLNLLGDPIIEITSDGDLAFSVIAMPETTIKPGESTTFDIEFAPTVSKFYEATVSIITNDTDMSPFTFTISGTGLEPGINIKQGEIYIENNTGSYDFGNFRVLETTSEVTFTIENSGTYELNLDGTPMIEISGTDAGLFTLNDSALSSPVAAGASTTFTLTFTPDSEGMKEATITIVSDDFNKDPYVFTVKGTGVQPEINVMQGATDLVSGTDSFDFGNTRVSETSIDVVFTIENLGTDTLYLTGSPMIEVTGTDAAMFSVVETLTKSKIPADSSTTFVVLFNPTSDGAKTATISIANDDFDENPYTFEITGTGTIPEINVKQGATDIPSSSGSFDFSDVKVYTSSEVTFTVENLGTADLLLSGTPKIAISGTDAAMFAINQTMTTSPVAPSNSTNFIVTYTPTSEGVKNASISIANDDSDENPYTFTIAGTGTIPEINIFQGTTTLSSGIGVYDFETVRVTRSSAAITFTVENLGTADLNLIGSPKINISGSDATHFIIDQTMTTGIISPGNTTLFTITFHPRSVGVKTATISIANDDSDENPYTFTVTGKTTTFDFNGDGYDDVIVGANGDDEGGSYSGCASIFLGNSNPNSTIDAANANIRLIGADSNDYFGNSVSNAGDVNGDGYDDVIVGAYRDNDGGLYSGCAFIFYGRSNPPSAIDATNANVKLVGVASLDYFGCSVSNAGDVNGDGFDDVIVGAYGDDDGGSYSGCAYIFFGGSNLSSTIDATSANVRLIGESSGDYFGCSVSGAGDVNADGYDDVIVGAYRDDDGGFYSGCAFMFYGGSSLTSAIDASNANVKLVGEYDLDNFGLSVSRAGDVNSDGYDDVIVGAHYNLNNSRSTGAAYLFLGQQNMSSYIDASNADVKMFSSDTSDYFGYSVSDAGDVNGDGFDDVIIGAYGKDRGGSSSGSAFIVFGNSSFVSSMNESYLDVEVYGNSTGDSLGRSVSGAGDFNGDGYADVIVGAEGDDDGGTSSGCAFIFTGSAQFSQNIRAYDARVRLIGRDPYDYFGCSVGGGN